MIGDTVMSRKKYSGGVVWIGSGGNLKVSKGFDSKAVVCIGCGCSLTAHNQSLDSSLCKNCFMVELAEIEAEDRREDSMSDMERLVKFFRK
jgi:hypothetical protein